MRDEACRVSPVPGQVPGRGAAPRGYPQPMEWAVQHRHLQRLLSTHGGCEEGRDTGLSCQRRVQSVPWSWHPAPLCRGLPQLAPLSKMPLPCPGGPARARCSYQPRRRAAGAAAAGPGAVAAGFAGALSALRVCARGAQHCAPPARPGHRPAPPAGGHGRAAPLCLLPPLPALPRRRRPPPRRDLPVPAPPAARAVAAEGRVQTRRGKERGEEPSGTAAPPAW